jgi:hypothetical protein
MICELEDKIFKAQEHDFESLALEVFHLQYLQNRIYRNFANALNIDPANIRSVAAIPFLPISFFKFHDIVTGTFEPEAVFESSGTTQTGNSKHLVRSAELYRKSFRKSFELFYGNPAGWCIIGLLPSYLERQHSSLVMMVDELIRLSGHPHSGFYLYDHKHLSEILKRNEESAVKTLLIGVTFALLDFSNDFRFRLRNTTVIETGGMKGRRKEITREEVHETLRNAWQLTTVHSEYGMTELLSQAYSKGEGVFTCPPWMRVMLRDEDDPLTIKNLNQSPQSGLINIIDLANIHSCSFIATDDIGRLYPDNSFEVLGRMDISDVRGCSLMYNSQL